MQISTAMEAFLNQVVEHFEGSVETSRLLSMSERLREQYENSLKINWYGMQPTCITGLPTGNEEGTYLAVDVGGSVLRIFLVDLHGRTSAETRLSLKVADDYCMDDSIKALEGEAFFDWMADMIMTTLCGAGTAFRSGAPIPMGLAWSYPVE